MLIVIVLTSPRAMDILPTETTAEGRLDLDWQTKLPSGQGSNRIMRTTSAGTQTTMHSYVREKDVDIQHVLDDPWAKPRKSKDNAKVTMIDDKMVEDEDEEEDDDFVGNGSDTSESIGSDDDDDAVPVRRPKLTPDEKKQRDAAILRSMGVNTESDDEALSGNESESVCSDDEDDDDDDEDDEDDEDEFEGIPDSSIVRSKTERIDEALPISKTQQLRKPMPKRTISMDLDNGLSIEERLKSSKKEREETERRALTDRLIERKLWVDGKPPEPEDLEEEEDPVECPAFHLVASVFTEIGRREEDLLEMVRNLSTLVAAETLSRIPVSGATSTDFNDSIAKFWGSRSEPHPFFSRWQLVLQHLLERTKKRQSSAFINAIAAAVASNSMCVFEQVWFFVDQDESDFCCAQCACVIEKNAANEVPGVELMTHRSATFGVARLKVLSVVGTRPTGSLAAARFIMCEKCRPIVFAVNTMLTAPHDMFRVAALWFLERRDSQLSSTSKIEAFGQSDVAAKLRQSIVESYRLLLTTSLD